MVSSAQLATANPPPLSYAERAKKAQNARSPSQVAQQRSTSQNTSSNTTNSTSLAAPSTVASRPAASTSPPAAPQVSPSSHPSSDARFSAASHPPPASSSKPATPSAADHAAEARSNGDVNRSADSLSAPSTAQKQTSAPPVNVWAKRKEQMAARGPAQAQSVNSAFPLPSQNSMGSLLPSHSSGSEPSTLPPSASSTSPNPSKSSLTAPATNGHLLPPGAHDDPFVVRPGRSPPNLTPPAIDDAESWPEVGQAAATPPHASNGRTEGKGKEGDEDRGHEREASQGHGGRKGEKTKWVPIPPEELQFERPTRTQHQRPRPPPTDRHSRTPGGPSGAPSTSSGSQQQSRAQSSTGMRPPPSHAGSVSHSQAQSRTGSVQSSPRHPSIRGGGRRLPDEGGAPTFGASRSIRSSGPNSPAAFAQPQPLPPQEFIPGVRPYINTSVGQVGRDSSTSLLSTIPDSGAPDMTLPGAYYPPPGPPLCVSPYHSPHPAGSPAPNPYALPPMAYPGQPAMPPAPAPGYGTPPYPMYAPYPYPYAQPYMYWPAPTAPPPHMINAGSPIPQPAQPSDPVIPPPTMVARPPPPSESDAVAGYRDVASALPPLVADGQVQQNGGSSGERGRRTRELSFGSIALEGAKSPSPTPGSPSTGTGAVHGGAAPGSEGEDGKFSALGEEQGGEEKTDGKVFAIFSIGVAPDEPRLDRLRSRTRSKGPATSVSAVPDSASNGAEGEQSAAADPVAVLADVAATVIDLTDSATKWEFGTTNHVDEAGIDQATNAELPVSSDVPHHDVPSHIPSISAAPFVPMGAPYAIPPYMPPVIIPGAPVNGIPNGPSPSAYTPRHPMSATESDEWEVRDYGYGFGRGGPPGSGPQSAYPRDDRPYRDRRDFQPQGGEHFGRPRRGSYGQGGFERGSYGGRRGRGLSGGYGGRGYSNRSFSGGRGGYANQGQQRQAAYIPPTPPPPPPQPELNGFYAPAPLATYIPSPYEAYSYGPFTPPPPPPQMAAQQSSAPLPVPQSQLLFPLDSMRYYLLGQLEYYLSSQNMAQDFYLRQQMDSRGWIPIPLIASFNRVRTLTTDPQIVTEVLALSSLVEVRDNHVRMHLWQQFVLPTAHTSTVEPEGGYQAGQAPPASDAPEATEHGEAGEYQPAHQNHDGEEDEEEDVEFVL